MKWWWWEDAGGGGRREGVQWREVKEVRGSVPYTSDYDYTTETMTVITHFDKVLLALRRWSCERIVCGDHMTCPSLFVRLYTG